MRVSKRLPRSYLVVLAMLIATVALCPAFGRTQNYKPRVLKVQKGLAVFYASTFHGEKTASGETFNKNEFVAAHPSLPLGTTVRVTNLENKKAIEVRIIDRGPSDKMQARGFIIDLSRSAAEALGFIKQGRTKVQIEVLKLGEE